MGAERTYNSGIAFIVEGATEKVFYEEYIRAACKKREQVQISDLEDCDGPCYAIGNGRKSILVKFDCTDSITQMTNSATWFDRACHGLYPGIPWHVFLAYDTDAYNNPITPFHEGDWGRLRLEIISNAAEIVDLAARADIEDVMLCDKGGVLAFLGLPESTEIPSGAKGKTKMKRLFRVVAINNAYHEGGRARPLIQSLCMDRIANLAPVPLKEIDRVLFG